MDVSSDIKNRTFGVEIEMCNLDRQQVSLPSGFYWSKEEEIVNTDGSSNKRFGGEVNTPPLNLFCMKDLHDLKSTYESMKNAGGVIKWTTYTHIHLYAGDLSVEQLKKAWLFFYLCYPYFKRYTKLSDWDELAFNCQPLPTEKYYQGLLEATTFEDIEKLFTNQSKKGFIRHAVNISAYFKTKTIEFRTYHGTNDFYECMACVYSTYRMFYFALSHDLNDFSSITSYEDFLSKIGLKYDCPKELIPLLYQGNPYSAIETFQTKPLPYNSRYASVLFESLKKHEQKEVCIINGFMYYYEMFLYKKFDISIYAQDPYCHLLYMLANGKMTLKYKEKLSWLEEYNKPTPSRQLALALYAAKLQKFFMSNSSRNEAIFASLRAKAKESIEKTEASSKSLLEMLTSCEYHIGTLQDAAKSKKVIFFNYGKNKQQKRTFKLIKENSDLELEFDVKRNDYYEIIENMPEDTYFYYLSNSPYLRNMNKIAMFDSSNGERRSAGSFLYCNKDCPQNKVSTYYTASINETNEIVPPDDIIIDDPQKLKILMVSGYSLLNLQKKYIRKVDMVSRCTFAFIVMYDKYTLGGFGFSLPQHKGFDLFQLTDFCTNNSIPRLSKLILYCIQTAEVQKALSRRMNKLCENVISMAYTHKPVSMKYRGVYNKRQDLSTSTYLAYEGQLGAYKSTKEVIDKYIKMLKNGNRK